MFVLLLGVYTFAFKNQFLNNFLYEKTFFTDDDARLHDLDSCKLPRR